MTEGQAILAAGALLAAALGASLLAGRVRVPGLVLFLGLGMLLGTDGLGWIHFDDAEDARVIGIVALALILFEGGLAAGFDEIRPVLVPAASLAVVGTIVTAIVAGLAAAWLFDLSTLEGLLLGSILASTDGAAVFAILRGSTLRRRLARTLEGEAGFNDPVAVLLVLGFVEWIQTPDYGIADMAVLFVEEIGIGLVVGLAVGWLSIQALKATRLASAGLYPVASLAIAGVAFGAADVLHGSGFLAVYLAGLALGSAQIPAKRTIVTFHAGMGWLAQVVMFLALGLLVFPSDLPEVMLKGTALASSWSSSPGRWACSRRRSAWASGSRNASCSGGRACAVRSPSSSPRSRSRPASTAASSSSTSSSSPCSSPPWCRGRRSRGWPTGSR